MHPQVRRSLAKLTGLCTQLGGQKWFWVLEDDAGHSLSGTLISRQCSRQLLPRGEWVATAKTITIPMWGMSINSWRGQEKERTEQKAGVLQPVRFAYWYYCDLISFFFCFLKRQVLLCCLGWPWGFLGSGNSLASVSRETGTMGTRHHTCRYCDLIASLSKRFR